MPSYRVLAKALPDLLRTWEVTAGELVMDLTGATPSMAAAMALAGVPFSSRVVMVGWSEASTNPDGEIIHIDGQERIWMQGNPWDEAASLSRREACDLFNRGAFGPAAFLFRHIETRVSGGQKPLYRAFSDLADGYAFWERFKHRQAWDKLKTAIKALEMASVWGGPSGLKALLPLLKQNAGFLEKLVLDPQEVKEVLAYDLLAHARRRAETDRHVEAAVHVLLRALESFAQHRLFKQFRIKSWDVQPEQLPTALQEICRTCFLDDVDGKYKLSPIDQLRALAGLGDTMGQAYQAQWVKMKPLLNAASHAVLGHGFETINPERFHQLYELVVKLTGVSEMMLPKFPTLNL
jgi:CRISPR-associated protein (TIGR02710 family)